MKTFLKVLAIYAVLLVAVSFGVNAIAAPLIICVQPSDRMVTMKNCDASAQLVPDEDDVAHFVAQQMRAPGPVIGWIGRNQDWTIKHYAEILREFGKYRERVALVYVKDELGLCKGRMCIGKDDALVHQATEMAHAAGFKTGVILTQNVIFAPGFKLPHTDVLGIDPYYVTMDQNLDMGGCKMAANVILSQWRCSVAKLRSMGWVDANGETKPLVYAGQGFGLKTDTPEFRAMYLQLQAEAYASIRLEADAVMSWGCHLGADETEDGLLVQLCGTPDEPKVTPYTVRGAL